MYQRTIHYILKGWVNVQGLHPMTILLQSPILFTIYVLRLTVELEEV